VEDGQLLLLVEILEQPVLELKPPGGVVPALDVVVVGVDQPELGHAEGMAYSANQLPGGVPVVISEDSKEPLDFGDSG